PISSRFVAVCRLFTFPARLCAPESAGKVSGLAAAALWLRDHAHNKGLRLTTEHASTSALLMLPNAARSSSADARAPDQRQTPAPGRGIRDEEHEPPDHLPRRGL